MTLPLPGVTQVVVRGATVQWTTTFYGADGAVVQPDSAFVNVAYTGQVSGAPVDGETELISMVPPTGQDVAWTAQWDTRNVFPGRVVYWSIHTGQSDPIPVAVEDGQFKLTANPANLPSF